VQTHTLERMDRAVDNQWQVRDGEHMPVVTRHHLSHSSFGCGRIEAMDIRGDLILQP
jgi:hypothetical protein